MREVHDATGSGLGDGLAVCFLFGLDHDVHHEQLALEREGIVDHVLALAGQGFRVIVDDEATPLTFLDAVYGRAADLAGAQVAGLFWSSHGGEDGSIQTITDELLSFRDIDPASVSPRLGFLVFSACHVGRWEPEWRRALRGARTYGWGKEIAFDRAYEFYMPREGTRNALDDILERELELPRGTVARVYLDRRGLETLPVPEEAPVAYTDVHEEAELAMESLQHDVLEPLGWDGDNQVYCATLDVEGVPQQVVVALHAGNAYTRNHVPGQQFVYVRAQAGALDPETDLQAALRETGALMTCRLQVTGNDYLILEGGALVSRVTPEQLAIMMDEAARVAVAVRTRLGLRDD
jgi:hypothetical protein